MQKLYLTVVASSPDASFDLTFFLKGKALHPYMGLLITFAIFIGFTIIFQMSVKKMKEQALEGNASFGILGAHQASGQDMSADNMASNEVTPNR